MYPASKGRRKANSRKAAGTRKKPGQIFPSNSSVLVSLPPGKYCCSTFSKIEPVPATHANNVMDDLSLRSSGQSKISAMDLP